ncbi:hypothetical protein [Legionella sainthelensi]|uniref:hypothetical protein n=1 Tax=Legionella sainthelensi TaxID=28087 RepID=UPI000E200B37|nr:hypothetical protein [Legionella sainthelensi]
MTFEELNQKPMTEFMRTYFKGVFIATERYEFQEDHEKMMNREYDLPGIGRLLIASPNLLPKVHLNEAIKLYDASMLTTLFQTGLSWIKGKTCS